MLTAALACCERTTFSASRSERRSGEEGRTESRLAGGSGAHPRPPFSSCLASEVILLSHHPSGSAVPRSWRSPMWDDLVVVVGGGFAERICPRVKGTQERGGGAAENQRSD